MADIKAFAALRPKPELAAKICELPYDVMSSAEAREMAAGNPLSFLHVSKPEIDLPAGTDLYAPEVYAKGRENFKKLIAEGALKQDAQPCFYIYRQIMGQHSQTGLVAAASCEDYLRNIIKKHELTRVDKEDDRVRHIETLNAQTGPVFLTYRASAALDELVKMKMTEAPDIDFTAKDGVRHTSWVMADAKTVKFVGDAFAQIPFLYICDGHHRSAAAARVYQSRKGTSPHPASGTAETDPELLKTFKKLGVTADEQKRILGTDAEDQRRLTSAATKQDESGSFLAVIFPHNQMQILPYNRVLKDLNGLTAAQLLEKLGAMFTIKEHPGGAVTPTRKHELGLYLAGKWHTLNFRPQFAATKDPIEKLDVTLLQKLVLAPLFGIDDPRTSKRINFVGGIRGTGELEKLVDAGEYACAFSMFPTGIEDLMEIADAGGIMPPKSTWFEPKLRDAMFCHMI